VGDVYREYQALQSRKSEYGKALALIEVDIKKLKDQERQIRECLNIKYQLINQMMSGNPKINIHALMAERCDPSFFGMSDSTPGAVIEELIDSPRNKEKVKTSQQSPEIDLEEGTHSSILDEQFEVNIKAE